MGGGGVRFLSVRDTDALSGAPWFPKSVFDLDICSKRVIMYGAGLDAEHPVNEGGDHKRIGNICYRDSKTRNIVGEE